MARVSTWAILLNALCIPAASRARAAGPTRPRPAVAAAQAKPTRTFWWKIPKAPAVPTNASEKALFALRGAWFDENGGAPWPLDNRPKGQGFGEVGDVFPVPQGKIPLYPGEIVVEAVFKSWTGYLTPSHKSIYTRIAYEIDRVLEAGPTALRAGQGIGVLYLGGTVLLSNGRVISWQLPSNRFQRKAYPKPSHQYVLFLQYVPALEGYLGRANIEVRGEKVLGKFYGWYSRRIPYGMPKQDFFDLIKNSILEYKSSH